MISDEESSRIKAQIVGHIEKTFPEEKKEGAKDQVLSLNSEELEEFIEKNNLSRENPNQAKCIFCSIVSGETESFKIGESKNAVAVLDINPVSRGHALVIPKEHSEKISKSVSSFANKIAKKMKSKLKSKEVKIQNSNLFGHSVINVVPVYENENPKAERKPAEKNELEEIQKILSEKKKKIEKKEMKIKEITEKVWLPRRRP